MDPADVRRKNFIAPDDFPHQTVRAPTTTRASTARALDKALRTPATSSCAPSRPRAASAATVKQLGIGLCSYVEWTGFGSELGTCEVGERRHGHRAQPARPRTARATRRRARSSSPTDARRRRSRTSRSSSPTPSTVARGMGTMGSRSLQVGGSAVINATDEVLEKARRLAAHLLEADDGRHRGRAGQGPRRRRLAGHGALVGAARRAAEDRRRAGGHRAGAERRERLRRRRTRRSRSARTSRSSRSTPRPATRGSIRHITVDDAGRITNPMLRRGPGPRRHRPGRRAGAVRGDRVRRGRATT